MVPVQVLDVVIDEEKETARLLLTDGEDNALPIYVDKMQGMTIAVGIKKLPFPRPFTHDLMATITEELGGSIKAVHISALENGTYFATIIFDSLKGERKIDARPSDAIALAIRMDCAIFAAPEVMEKAAQKMQGKELEQAKLHKGIDELIDQMIKELPPEKPPAETK